MTAVMLGVWVLAGAAEAEAQRMRLGEVLFESRTWTDFVLVSTK